MIRLYHPTYLQRSSHIAVEADLRTLLLSVRAGAIVPMGLVKQHTAKNMEQPVTLQVFPGVNGSFVWYDDDGESFRYEQGQYLEARCEWDNKSRTLTRPSQGKLGEGRWLRVSQRGAGESREVRLAGAVTHVRL